MARFTLPRDLYHGKGALEALKTLKGKKAFVVVGGGSMKRFGFLDKVVSYLQEAGMEVKLFEGVEPDPSVDTVMKGAAAMTEFGPDWIVSIGGGSREDLERAMEKLSRVVGLGRNIVIFPEGTRMRGGRLGDFKSMAFRLSRRFGMDVAPGAIVSSEPVFTRGTSLIPERNGFSFSIKLLEPLHPGDFDSADSLSAAAYRAISRACKDMRASFPEKT